MLPIASRMSEGGRELIKSSTIAEVTTEVGSTISVDTPPGCTSVVHVRIGLFVYVETMFSFWRGGKSDDSCSVLLDKERSDEGRKDEEQSATRSEA